MDVFLVFECPRNGFESCKGRDGCQSSDARRRAVLLEDTTSYMGPSLEVLDPSLNMLQAGLAYPSP